MKNSVFKAGIFDGKVALITGGGTGICKGIAAALAAHGAKTVITSRSMEHLEPSAREIAKASGRECLPVAADVRKPEEVEAAVAAALSKFGRIDILVNGAAGNFLCPSEELSYNAFGTVLDIDAKGTWNFCRAVHSAWMGKHGGSILNISATLHYRGTPLQLHVSAAKAAIDALTYNLAVEWGPQGVRVNAIAPGPVGDTEGAKRLFPKEVGEALRKNVPIGRLGSIDDIANLALFVLSDAGTNLNGSILVSDGGHILSPHSGTGVTVEEFKRYMKMKG